MTIGEGLKILTTLAAQHGTDKPLYSYDGDLEREVAGIKHCPAESVENYDDPDGPELPLYPERIFLKN